MSIIKLFAALAVVLSCVSTNYAQEVGQPIQTADPALTKPADQRTSNYRGDLSAAGSKIHRASEVIGLNVMTPNNEDTIGEVNDLVFDGENGTVRYAAVSVGGFLGIGDKIVAIPWKSFESRKDADGNSYLSLDTTKEKLEKAPGFDQDNWPDFGNQQWSTDNDRHFGVSVNVNTNR